MEILVGILISIIFYTTISLLDRKLKVEGTIVWKIFTIFLIGLFLAGFVLVGRYLFDVKLPNFSNSEIFRKDNVKASIALVCGIIASLLLLFVVITCNLFTFLFPSIQFKKAVYRATVATLMVLFVGNIIIVPNIITISSEVSFAVVTIIGLEIGLGMKVLVLSFYKKSALCVGAILK